MDDIRQTAINRFRAYLERRQFSAHTLASYTLDLHVFFRTVTVPLAQVSFREVDHFVEDQHQQGRAWATINRRLNALKHFFDFCLEQQLVVGNPVKPSHFVRRGRPLPKALSQEQTWPRHPFRQCGNPRLYSAPELSRDERAETLPDCFPRMWWRSGFSHRPTLH